MKKYAGENMKIAIVGAGKLGLKLTEALSSGNHSITLIDKNQDLLTRISSQMDVLTLPANAKETHVLESINIDTYDYLISATDRDEKNMVIASFAKKLGCKSVIARVRDPEHMNQMEFIKEAMEIDYLANPDMMITNEIYKYLVEKYSLSDGVFSAGKIALLQFNASKLPQFVGMSASDINALLPNMLIAAVTKFGKVIIPDSKTIISAEDELFVVGEQKDILKLNEKVHDDIKYKNLQKVMIIGGGKTGFYLAKRLDEYGADVKVIEINKERCRYLAAHLDSVMILNGDAADPEFLESENLEEMDAFITATGFDEENLLLALTAKQHNIEDVIAKISRESYADLIGKLGVDMALNPLDIMAAHILRFMQGSTRILSAEIIQGQAELIEVLVTDNMKIINTPINNLQLPPGMLIAAVDRDKNVIIPDRNFVIKKGDRLLIFCLLSDIAHIEKFMKTGGKSRFFKFLG